MSSADSVRRLSRALATGLAAAMVALTAAPLHTAAAASAQPAPTESSVGLFFAPRPTGYQSDVLYIVNYYRRRAGVPIVRQHWQLYQAAQTHANEMARRRQLTHIGLDGSNAGARISRTGYNWWIWGENVAAGQITALQVVNAWYNSPPHRRMMLDPRYRHLGLGRAVASDGKPYWDLLLASPR